MPWSPYRKRPGELKPKSGGYGGTWSSGSGGGEVTSGIGTTPVSVQTGATIQNAINAEIITEPGIVPYVFHATVNAEGQMYAAPTTNALSIPVPFRGSVIGMSVVASTACSGTYTVYLSGGAQGAYCTLAAGTSTYQSWTKGTYGFTAGATLDVRASSVATSAVVVVTVYTIADPTSVS